jgi:hypothetical protein
VAVDLEMLKAERDRSKESLRELETETRRLDAEVKSLRQREVQTKREIEALSALIDIAETRSQATPSESQAPAG